MNGSLGIQFGLPFIIAEIVIFNGDGSPVVSEDEIQTIRLDIAELHIKCFQEFYLGTVNQINFDRLVFCSRSERENAGLTDIILGGCGTLIDGGEIQGDI